jgi:lipopolysaccharide biosynthesis protein
MTERRVCLFAQYNAGARLPAHVLHSWRRLREAGFAVHAALSGKVALDAADRDVVDALGVMVWPRPNVGLDFGAWAMLVAAGVAAGADEVLLANDSVLGPFAPLGPIMRRMAGYDAWGMVASREGRPHLQSWFVLMTRAAFEAEAVRRLWRQNWAAMGKDEVIVHGEFGLAAAFAAAGLDVGAVWRRPFGLRPSRVVATNPMHFHWREVLDAGVPFVKRDLVERNPVRIIGAGGWRAALRARGWDAPWLDEVPGPAVAGGLGLRQTVLQVLLRGGRARLVRERLAGR